MPVAWGGENLAQQKGIFVTLSICSKSFVLWDTFDHPTLQAAHEKGCWGHWHSLFNGIPPCRHSIIIVLHAHHGMLRINIPFEVVSKIKQFTF